MLVSILSVQPTLRNLDQELWLRKRAPFRHCNGGVVLFLISTFLWCLEPGPEPVDVEQHDTLLCNANILSYCRLCTRISETALCTTDPIISKQTICLSFPSLLSLPSPLLPSFPSFPATLPLSHSPPTSPHGASSHLISSHLIPLSSPRARKLSSHHIASSYHSIPRMHCM